MQTTQNDFLKSFEKMSQTALQHKDPVLMKRALELIPVNTLNNKSTNLLRRMQSSKNERCFKDALMIELVKWFKSEFFEWVNGVPCRVCGEEDDSSELTKIMTEGGIKVEVLYCCDTETKFYRYNDLEMLLNTRRGRCGEYANCFTLFCCALGYDARLVYARFDHAWTEIYSLAEKRWIHIDPSEGAIDTPLMYQIGWKRKIDYVLACSSDEVQDVTWRYSNSHSETRKLRTACTEKELIDTIIRIRNNRLQGQSEARRNFVLVRAAAELMLLTVDDRIPSVNETKGRISGNLEWREKRGEVKKFYEFKLLETEISNKQFNIQYNCDADVYERFLQDAYGEKVKVLEKKERWESWHFYSKNIYRKFEPDWKFTYLAREEGTDYAEISWKFDFSETPLVVKKYHLKFESNTFVNGEIDMQLINDQNKSNEIIGSNQFTLRAILKGGTGDNAWQHTQLFRQRNNDKRIPFIFNIIFE